MIERQNTKEYLEKRLNRTARPDEIENAQNDVGLLVPLILEELERLHCRIKLLEHR